MRNKLTRLLAGLLVLTLVLSGTQTYKADEEHRGVKVGVYEMEGFHDYDELGQLGGYCIDYLNVIAGVTGWKYEYVKLTDFSDGCEKLENREIDLLAPAMITSERKEIYDYSELAFGTEYSVLVTEEGREDLFYEDFEALDSARVAVLNNYPLTDYFKSYMKMHDFESELVYYDVIGESVEALEAGQVDAIVTSIMDIRDNQKMLGRFSPQPFYFLTWKGNTEFLVELNEAMTRVQNTYPRLLDDLLLEHYPAYNTQAFTREEMEFVRYHRKAMKVAYLADRKPLSFTNEKGELDGISKGIFDRVAEISGLKFEYVPLPQGEITYEFLVENDIDIITGVEYNKLNLNSTGVMLSSPYITSKKIMVSDSSFEYIANASYKMAIATGSQTLKKVFSSKYPNIQIVDYASDEECYEALLNGEVDILLQNQYVAEHMLKRPLYSTLSIVPVEGLADDLCFSTLLDLHETGGLNEEESRILLSVLEKSLSKMTEEEMSAIIVSACLKHQYEMTFLDFLYAYRISVTVSVLAATIMLISLVVYLQAKRKRAIEKAKEERRQAIQQRRYKTIVECSDDMIYEISLDGESSVGSDKIKEKFGWEIPKKIEDLDFSKAMQILHVHPEDEKNFKETILASGEGRFDELTVRIQRADESYIWCKLSRTLLMDDSGNVVSILGKIVDVDDEIREKKQLEIRTRTDGLTGLLNKATFEKEVREYVEKNSTESACFVFLDMDHFKDINDNFGHSVGDQVIKDTAKKIQLLFANFDLVGRFGGDEFCIFVKEIPRDTLIDRLKFAVKKMEQEYPYDGGVVKLSASIGAAYCRKDHVSYKELLDVADTAAYNAKDNGRNCYIIKDID